MDVIIEKKTLSKQLSITDSVTSSRSTTPILSNVLIEASDGFLTTKASNLETNISVKNEAGIREDGSVVVNSKKLISVIRELPESDIHLFTEEDSRLSIESMDSSINAKFTIMGTGKENFPLIKTEFDDNYFVIDSDTLKNIIRKVIFSISQDETKYSLTGVFMEKYNGNLNVVATDGKRLALVEKKLSDINLSEDDLIIPEEGVIIPKTALSEILRYNFENNQVMMGFSGSQIFLSYDNVNVSSSLIEGRFPDYKKIIPIDRENFFIVERDALYGAIKRVSVLVDESYKQVKFSILKNRMIVSTQSPTVGGAKEEIGVEYDGEDIDIALNYQFMLDCLKEIESDRVKIDFEDSERAITVRGVDEEGYLNIIMPMKII